MRARARILRVLGGLCLVVGVFFASFVIASALRHPIAADDDVSQEAQTAPQDDEPESEPATSTTMAPQLSEPPITVASTGPALPLVAGIIDSRPANTTGDELVEPLDIEPLDIDPVFSSIHDELASQIDVEIRLPKWLDDEASNWFATIDSISPTSYVVHLGDSEDCNAASACRVSTFTGRQSVSANPVLPAGTPVPLPNGLSGVFIDSSCGEGCNNGFIVWIEDDVRYSVGSQIATTGSEVLDLVWRSIDTALPTPSGPEACGPGAPKHDGTVARTITTTLDGGRSMHWIAVCSELGFNIEIIEAPGDLRWVDVDGDGTRDTVVTNADGTSTIFAIDANRPLAVLDSAGGRLQIDELGCINGTRRQPFDVSTGELLEFVNDTTVRRVPVDDASEVSVGDC